MIDGFFFCATLTGCRRGHTPFVQAGAEAFDTGVEAGKPDPRCSWEDHSERVGVGVGDESTESRKVVQPLHLPLVIRPVHRTYVVVFRTDELLYGGHKGVSRFEMPCIRSRWTGERWVEQVSMLYGTVC